jgi:hypothetical protein
MAGARGMAITMTLGVLAAAVVPPARAQEPAGREAAGTAAAYKAPTLHDKRGRTLRGPYRGWARRSLVPLVPGPIRVHLRGCPYDRSFGGCVYNNRLRAIYLDGRLRPARRKALLFHELGHLYDFRVMNERDRRAFKRIFRTRRSWWRGNPKLAELFAEAYSWCARYRRIRDIRAFAFYGYDPSPRQHLRACALIRRAADPDSPPPQPPREAPAVTADPPPPEQPPPGSDRPPSSPPPGDDDTPEEEPPLVPLPPVVPFPPVA